MVIIFSEYLKKSQENKDKNDKEVNSFLTLRNANCCVDLKVKTLFCFLLCLCFQRLESYYKRNYRDYFGALEGSLKQKKELTETEKGILEWLEQNK